MILHKYYRRGRWAMAFARWWLWRVLSWGNALIWLVSQITNFLIALGRWYFLMNTYRSSNVSITNHMCGSCGTLVRFCILTSRVSQVICKYSFDFLLKIYFWFWIILEIKILLMWDIIHYYKLFADIGQTLLYRWR